MNLLEDGGPISINEITRDIRKLIKKIELKEDDKDVLEEFDNKKEWVGSEKRMSKMVLLFFLSTLTADTCLSRRLWALLTKWALKPVKSTLYTLDFIK